MRQHTPSRYKRKQRGVLEHSVMPGIFTFGNREKRDLELAQVDMKSYEVKIGYVP